MSVENKTSSKRVIEAAIRDFGLANQDWFADAKEWIGNGLLEIGVVPIFQKVHKSVMIESYKVKLPCTNECFMSVKYRNDNLEYLHDNNRSIDKSQGEWFTIEGVFLHFSFTGKVVTITYLQFSYDDEGYLCIPDNIFLIEALKWKIMAQLLVRGATHPVISYKEANAEWKSKKDIAANNLIMPTPYEFDDIMRAWHNMIPNLKYN